jgi:GAF domain-containing protein
MSAEENPLTQSDCPLSDVLATEMLAQRTPRASDPSQEIDAVSVLSNAMLTGSDRVLDLLVHAAMRLCRAHSAGISLEDLAEAPPVFRWRAIAGRLAPFLHGTMPRFFSPCGETVARNQLLLMRSPERHYPYATALGIPLTEVLLAPFAVGGRTVGTVWIVAHDDRVQFDAEDARRVQLLSSFAGLAVTAIERSRLRNRLVD